MEFIRGAYKRIRNYGSPRFHPNFKTDQTLQLLCVVAGATLAKQGRPLPVWETESFSEPSSNGRNGHGHGHGPLRKTGVCCRYRWCRNSLYDLKTWAKGRTRLLPRDSYWNRYLGIRRGVPNEFCDIQETWQGHISDVFVWYVGIMFHCWSGSELLNTAKTGVYVNRRNHQLKLMTRACIESNSYWPLKFSQFKEVCTKIF